MKTTNTTIEVKLFHKTTDADLFKGLTVAYADKSGNFTKWATIDTVYRDGCLLYVVDGGSYRADELKLIASDIPGRFLNVWNSKKDNLIYYSETNLIFELGDYKIFKQFTNCYLYTYKGIGITQLGGINKELVQHLHNNTEPQDEKDKNYFIIRRTKESLQKGFDLLNAA